MDDITGLKAGTHYIEWFTVDDLAEKVAYYLNPANEKERKKIAKAGEKFTKEHHSFDARVRELFELIEAKAVRQIGGVIKLRKVTDGAKPFGLRGSVTGNGYYYDPANGRELVVDARDASDLLVGGKWERA
jgi:hypothetical protein